MDRSVATAEPRAQEKVAPRLKPEQVAAPAIAPPNSGDRATPKQLAATARGSKASVSAAAGSAKASKVTKKPSKDAAPAPKLSKREASRLRIVQKRSKKKSSALGDHETPTESKDQFQAAAKEPAEETAGRALKAHAKGFENLPPPSPQILLLTLRLRLAMKKKRPADEDDLGKADPKAYSKEASNALDGDIKGQASGAAGKFDALKNRPKGTAEKQPDPLLPHKPAPESAAIGAKKVSSDPTTDADVSLGRDRQAIDDGAKRGKLDHPNVKYVQDGPIHSAIQARGEFGELEATKPAAVMKSDKELRATVASSFKKAEAAALKKMLAARKEKITSVDGDKAVAVTGDEKIRLKLGNKLNEIFDETERLVLPILAGMSAGALDTWESEIKPLSDNFGADLAEVDAWIKERKSSVISSVLDWATGLPGFIVRAFESAEKRFVEGAIDLMIKISRWVAGRVQKTETHIASGRKNIETEIAKLPEHLRKFGDEERTRIAGKFDKLEGDVQKASKNLNRQLAKNLFRTVESKRAKIAKLREMSKGLFQKFSDFVGEFVDDPLRAMVNGLLRVVGIPPATFWNLVDRFATVIDQIADKPMVFANNLGRAMRRGFERFKTNIASHLFRGLLTWLTSKLPDVRVPKKFSPKGIIKMLLQILGISWVKIRKQLVSHIGEKNIKRIEMAMKFVSLLVSRGLEGIWDFLKDRFNPKALMDTAVEAIKSYIIDKVVTRATIEIIAMFNPVGAVLKAVQLIYTVVSWVINNASKIFTLIDSVVTGASNIMKGAIGGAAKVIEGALGRLVPIVIDLFARLVSLGDLPSKIKDLVEGLRGRVDAVIKKAVAWLAKKIGIKGPADKNQKEEGAIGEVVPFQGPKGAHKVYIDVRGNDARVMMQSNAKSVSGKLKEFQSRLGELQDVSRHQRAAKAIKEADDCERDTNKDADSLVRGYQATRSASRRAQKEDELKKGEHKIAELLHRIYELFGEAAASDRLDYKYDYPGGGAVWFRTPKVATTAHVTLNGNRGLASLSSGPKKVIAAAKEFLNKQVLEGSEGQRKALRKNARGARDKAKVAESSGKTALKTKKELRGKKSKTLDNRMTKAETDLGEVRKPLGLLTSWAYIGLGDIFEKATKIAILGVKGKAPTKRRHRIQDKFLSELIVAEGAARDLSKGKSGSRSVTLKPSAPKRRGEPKAPVNINVHEKRAFVHGLGTYRKIRKQIRGLSEEQRRRLRATLLGESIKLRDGVKLTGSVELKATKTKMTEEQFVFFARRLRVLLHVEAVRAGTAPMIVDYALEATDMDLDQLFTQRVLPHVQAGFKKEYRKQGAKILDKTAKAIVTHHAEKIAEKYGRRGIVKANAADQAAARLAKKLQKKYLKSK